jgi:hypothetical protein
MKKALMLSLLVAASSTISVLADTLVIVPGFGPYQFGSGGEITATLNSGVSGAAYVPGVTANLVQSGTFQTFCLELHEGISATTYTAIPAMKTQVTGFDLNKGTAWLYQQFAAGTLSGYNFGGTVAERKASADALQQEIWHLMGNQVPTANSIFDPIVNAAAALGQWNVQDPSTPEFSPVRLLNDWTIGQVGQREGAAQDVLFIPGVPDGGLTLALLGMGLTGVGFISRRSRK